MILAIGTLEVHALSITITCRISEFETRSIALPQVIWENKYPSNENAGNFGVPAITTDPEKLKVLQDQELKNGRLAMIGIMSYACAVSIPNSVPFYPF